MFPRVQRHGTDAPRLNGRQQRIAARIVKEHPHSDAARWVLIGISLVICVGVLIWLARAHSAWDPRHDIVAALITAGLIAWAVSMHWDRIQDLAVF